MSSFPARGHKIHVCKRCQRLPKSQRQAIEDRDAIFGFMEQSHISKKNVARLEKMVKSEERRVASLAAMVLEVALVTPYKRRRLKILSREHLDLLRKLDEAGLVFAPWLLGDDSDFDETGCDGAEFFLEEGDTESPGLRTRKRKTCPLQRTGIYRFKTVLTASFWTHTQTISDTKEGKDDHDPTPEKCERRHCPREATNEAGDQVRNKNTQVGFIAG